MNQWIELEERFGAHNYHPLPVVLSRGRGCWVWDVEGKKYLDFLSAYSALNHGHRHPKLVAALRKQLGHLALTSRAFYTDQLGPFLRDLCEVSKMERAILMNTGAEAVETAIKAARKWGYEQKKIPDGKAEILVAKQNFHGRTTSIISFSSDPLAKEGYGPYTPGFRAIAFGSSSALEKAISNNTCAFLVEPAQGEAGIILPPKGWLKEVREICTRKGILLILDEIQTGLGRTGKMFAFEHEKIRPDGLILGKALGGGLLPVSAFLSSEEVMRGFRPGTHGSTFGANPLACAVAREALKLIAREKLAEKSAQLGAYFLKELKKIRSPLITEIRGMGLWIGIDFDPKQCSGREIAKRLMHEGILCKETHEITVRIAPPLTITKKEIDWALKKITKVVYAA